MERVYSKKFPLILPKVLPILSGRIHNPAGVLRNWELPYFFFFFFWVEILNSVYAGQNPMILVNTQMTARMPRTMASQPEMTPVKYKTSTTNASTTRMIRSVSWKSGNETARQGCETSAGCVFIYYVLANISPLGCVE